MQLRSIPPKRSGKQSCGNNFDKPALHLNHRSHRRGGKIDITRTEAVVSYLRSCSLIDGAESVERIENLEGGISCNTVLVRRKDAPHLVIKQALDKLRVNVEWRSDPRRIHREAAGMRYLSRICPAGSIAPLLHEDFEQHVIVMGEVTPPYFSWKVRLLRGEVDREHFLQFGDLLATIHRESTQDRELVERDFADRSFFESLRVEPYYRYTAENVPASRSFLLDLIDETQGARFCVVHGDFGPKNILTSRGQLVLLDHEVIHYGDPAFDVGFSLAHLLSKAHHLTTCRVALLESTADYVAQYERGVHTTAWFQACGPRAARHTLACLLARVAGRSPFEYLDDFERARQKEIVVGMMRRPPQSIASTIAEFAERLMCR